MPQPGSPRLNRPARPSDRGDVKIRKAIGTARRRSVALAAAVLTLGLGTGAAGSLALAAGDASSAALALRTASVRGALDPTFQRYADTMHDLVAAAATQPTPGLSATVARIVGARLPGAHQVVVVDAGGTVRAGHTADGSTPPAPTGLSPQPELAHALDLARGSGRLVASPAHVLPADRDLPPARRQLGFELIAPVSDGEFRGWVVIGVRAADLLRESLLGAGVTGVATVLTETSAGGGTREVARWSEGGAPLGAERGTVDVALAGHTWQVLVRPTTELVGAGRAAAAPLALLGTFLISALMAGIGLAAGGRRAAEPDRGAPEAELTSLATAAAAHLQAPLHTIAGYTELLREEAPRLDEAARGFLDRISGSTGRMLRVVDEMLAYLTAADVALRPEPVDAGGVALGVVAGRLDHVTGERPSVDVGDLPAVTADAMLLGEVLGRLVDNALRFVRPGTPALVTIRAREHSPGWWRIEVADRGIGVPEEQRTRIFEPFHRAPAAEGFPGAGLGLAVCRRLVALHGGEIGVATNPGGGSVFWFTVAATDVTPAAGHELLAADLA